ncbi:MAG: S41 family peptidase [Candidatus Neomarinimicrobiota bacterium]
MWLKTSSPVSSKSKAVRIAALLAAIMVLAYGTIQAADLFRSISDNLRTYNGVVKNLLAEYVDDIDTDELIDASIKGMLENLDPYTVYIRAEDQTAVDMLTQGKYGGVGIRLGVRDDILTVISPMEGTPAQRAGVRPGDRIIKIDSTSTSEYNTEEAARHIRGKPGTKVVLTFTRIGESEPFAVTIVREQIKVHDMPFYGIVDGLGYIRLTRFSRDTAKEFRDAVVELRTDGMSGLVIDLRDNPGGLLRDAVVMVDAMVEPGVIIVETRGRTRKAMRKHQATTKPVLGPETPVVVLVNGGSASASEIVAGALQDLDRAVIIGTPTFGKGLVQSIFPLGKNTSIKMTTAKYYIPSGRLIQKEDYLDNGVLTDGLDKHDSLFVTRNGRQVKGGGGIVPDIEVPTKILPPLTRSLWGQSQFFSFAAEFQGKYDLTPPVQVTPEMEAAFKEYIKQTDIEVMFPGENRLKEFDEGLAELEEFTGEVDLSQLQEYYRKRHETAFDDEIEFISKGLRLEFAAMKGGLAGRIQSGLIDDKAFIKAQEILANSIAYQKLLQPVDDTVMKH